MAKFRATTEDLSDLVRREKLSVFKRQYPYPVAALAAGCLLLAIFPPAGFFALGMCGAWTLSTFWELRYVRKLYAWRYSDDVDVDVRDDGVQFASENGRVIYPWGGDMVVRSVGTCFVLERGGEDFAILPKRHLDSRERMMLQGRLQS